LDAGQLKEPTPGPKLRTKYKEGYFIAFLAISCPSFISRENNVRKKTQLTAVVGLVMLVFGAGLLTYIVRSQAVSATNIVQPSAQTTTTSPPRADEIEGEPVELVIPSLKMDLPIIPGYYDAKAKIWTLTLSEVQYATITPEPNNIEGNTFLYGHYRQAVFARLHTIPANAQAIVKTSNDHTFYYQLSNIRNTNPGDDSVFTYRGKPILTIQTCTGIFFQYRQFYTFTLQKVD
jgi:LPXTG-site transpeptidase (sortase) family protein